MIDIDNKTSFNLTSTKIAFLEEIANLYSDREIELIITNSSDIQNINRAFRGIDKPTDVLSFPFEDTPFAPLGSIVISIDFVKNRAVEFNHSMEDELTLLFIHGLLHLVGFDHEVDEKMRQEEERLIKKYNLPTSLIIRTENC